MGKKMEIEKAVCTISEGLQALHELGHHGFGGGISAATFATCVEQMTLGMQAQANKVLEILDRKDAKRTKRAPIPENVVRLPGR